MPAFVDWLARVLEAGESVQDEPPVVPPRREVTAFLEKAYWLHAADVGGPPIAFDSETAHLAAATLADACWRLVTPDPDASLPKNHLGLPRSPSSHLAADLTLRFLPSVYRRAKPRGDTDAFVVWVVEILRTWPLSGVVAQPPGGPASLDFGGHPGLALLYAERLVECPTAAWVPRDGVNREQVERVFHQRGMPVPVLPTEESSP